MYESMLSFPGGLFGEFDRLQRTLDDVFGLSGLPASIRSVAPGTFPAINIGSTPSSAEIYAARESEGHDGASRSGSAGAGATRPAPAPESSA